MATYSKIALSGSTDGKGILLTASGTPGTTIHDAHATAIDEVWAWAWNSDSSDAILRIEYGGTTDPTNVIEHTLATGDVGLQLVIPGLIATNSVNIDGFVNGSGSIVVIYGYVNRIT